MVKPGRYRMDDFLEDNADNESDSEKTQQITLDDILQTVEKYQDEEIANWYRGVIEEIHGFTVMDLVRKHSKMEVAIILAKIAEKNAKYDCEIAAETFLKYNEDRNVNFLVESMENREPMDIINIFSNDEVHKACTDNKYLVKVFARGDLEGALKLLEAYRENVLLINSFKRIEPESYVSFADYFIKADRVVREAIIKVGEIQDPMPIVNIFEEYEGVKLDEIASYIKENPRRDSGYMNTLLTHEKFKEVFELYKGDKIVDALTRAAELDQGIKLWDYFTHDKIIEMVKKESAKAKHIAHIYNKISRYDNDEYEIISILENRDSLAVELSQALSHITADPLKMAKVFDIFYDKFPEIYVAWRESEGVCHFDELLTDKAYYAISKSKNRLGLMKEMMKIDYTSIQEQIVKDVSYHDLGYVKRALDTVMNIHQDRDSTARQSLEDGFYSELNRALLQSNNSKGQSRNLKRYCNEVIQQMQENASELMVIHNGP